MKRKRRKLNLKASDTAKTAPKEPGDGAPEAYVLHLRRPMPLARAIRWDPVLLEPGRPEAESDASYAIFISQAALRDVQEHVWATDSKAHWGFLLGVLFECPKTQRRYTVIESVLRGSGFFEEANQATILATAWGAMDKERHRVGAELLGWYHSHPHLGVVVSEADAESQLTQFGDPWHCMLVMTPPGDDQAAGFFRSTGRGGLSRRQPVPFHELLEPESLLPGVKRSYMAWSNYRTTEAVERETDGLLAPPAEPSVAAPDNAQAEVPVETHDAPPVDAEQVEPVAEVVEPVAEVVEPVAEVVEPVAEVVEPVAEAVAPEVEAPEPAAEAVEPVAEDVAPVAEDVAPQVEAPEPAAEAVAPVEEAFEAVADVTEAPAAEIEPVSEVEAETEAAAEEVEASPEVETDPLAEAHELEPEPHDAEPVAEPEPVVDAVEPEPEPAIEEPEPGFRPAAAAAASRPADILLEPVGTAAEKGPRKLEKLPTSRIETPDLVLPTEVDTTLVPFARRANGGLIGMLAALGVLFIVVYLMNWTSEADGDQPETVIPVETRVNPAVGRFEAHLESLDQAIVSYGERQVDFDLRRISCDGLGLGYREVDDRFVSTSRAFVDTRTLIALRQRQAYDSLVGRMDEVNQHFDESGCPRPD